MTRAGGDSYWETGGNTTDGYTEIGNARIAADPVIADMLAGLGAQPLFCEAPFAPEGGAYGGGPTYGHDHSHSNSHSHADQGEGGHDH